MATGDEMKSMKSKRDRQQVSVGTRVSGGARRPDDSCTQIQLVTVRTGGTKLPNCQ